MSAALRFAVVYATLTASHEVADHWVQINSQAVVKGEPGWPGRLACASHVATYTATQCFALLAADRLLGLRLNPRRIAVALVVSAGTHYWADRSAGHWRDETPHGVARLAAVTGHADWLKGDPNAGYRMDQAWHKGFLWAAALIAAGRETG